MNTLLWVLQVLWGTYFSVNGFGKVSCLDPVVWERALDKVPWFSAVPQGLFILIGAAELLGGLGLILPALTRVRPILTPVAASGLTLVMIFAAGFHIMRGEYAAVPINVVLGSVAAFIAYGRFVLRPVGAGAPTPLRLLTGVAVLVAMLALDFATL